MVKLYLFTDGLCCFVAGCGVASGRGSAGAGAKAAGRAGVSEGVQHFGNHTKHAWLLASTRHFDGHHPL